MNKPIDITGGVDTHKDNHVAAALDHLVGFSEPRRSRQRGRATRHSWRGSGPSARSCPSVLKALAHGESDGPIPPAFSRLLDTR